MARRKARRRPRRAFLYFLVFLLAGTWFFWDQQNRLQSETIEFSSPRLPAAFDGFRIVLLSDLHDKQFGTDNQTLLKEVASLNPDLIAITGDLVDRSAQAEELAALPALAQALSALAPTYFVTGNHEWATRQVPAIKALLQENGVTPLTNEYLTLEREGASIVLAGIDDPNGPKHQKTLQTLTEEIRADLGDPFLLLMSHRNEDYPLYAECDIDFTLCGHAHGGVIRFPFTDGLIDNSHRGLFPSYTAGLYPLESGTLMVSRGLGNSGMSFRLWNRPHVPLIILRTEDVVH